MLKERKGDSEKIYDDDGSREFDVYFEKGKSFGQKILKLILKYNDTVVVESRMINLTELYVV